MLTYRIGSLIEHLPLDEEIYRKITALSYSEHIPVQKIINDMLKEYMNVYVLAKKIGYALISKYVLKTTFDNTPEDKVMELSRKIATRYRKDAILLHGIAQSSKAVGSSQISTHITTCGTDQVPLLSNGTKLPATPGPTPPTGLNDNWGHEMWNERNVSGFVSTSYFEPKFHYVDHPTGLLVSTPEEMQKFASSLYNAPATQS